MNTPLRIVVDQNMPGIERLFGGIAEIIKADGRCISAETLKNADALLCRSITKVNSELLQNSKVKFVGTATIGTDHLDTDWLESNSIHWSNAAGCNAAAVAQYVLSAMAFWAKSTRRLFDGLTIGIVGAGNVGTELARCLKFLGINYRLCDPPLKNSGDQRDFVDLEQILKCDVITLHVPINNNGRNPTRHLFSKTVLSRLTNSQLLINASRGAVIDNLALSDYLEQSKSASVILDVFENEPSVPQKLLNQCLLATPHIAGHTLEGKLRGSWMIYRAFCGVFELQEKCTEEDLYPEKNEIFLVDKDITTQLLSLYDIQQESVAFRTKNTQSIAKRFDRLRQNATQMSNGRIRRDYSGWQFKGDIRLPL